VLLCAFFFLSVFLFFFLFAHVDVYLLTTAHIGHIVGSISNQYVVWNSDTRDALIVDLGLSKDDVDGVFQYINANSLHPHAAWITHPHTDHGGGAEYAVHVFSGMPMYMTDNEVIDDLEDFSRRYFNISFDFDSTLLPLPANPQEVLYVATPTHNVTFGVITNFSACEADYESLLYSPELGAMFTGDLVYGPSTHLYLGPNVDGDMLESWKGILNYIAAFAAHTSTSQSAWTIYPGHGNSSAEIDELIFENASYLAFFTEILCVDKGNTTHMVADLQQQYPKYGGVALHFLPFNQATWADLASQDPGPCHYEGQ